MHIIDQLYTNNFLLMNAWEPGKRRGIPSTGALQGGVDYLLHNGKENGDE
jgi:hypothetical protein